MTDVNTQGCADCEKAFVRRGGLGVANNKCPGCAARSIAVSTQAALGLRGGDDQPLKDLTRGRCQRAGLVPDASFRAQVKAWFHHIYGGAE